MPNAVDTVVEMQIPPDHSRPFHEDHLVLHIAVSIPGARERAPAKSIHAACMERDTLVDTASMASHPRLARSHERPSSRETRLRMRLRSLSSASVSASAAVGGRVRFASWPECA
jgi:hypothetical protein